VPLLRLSVPLLRLSVPIGAVVAVIASSSAGRSQFPADSALSFAADFDVSSYYSLVRRRTRARARPQAPACPSGCMLTADQAHAVSCVARCHAHGDQCQRTAAAFSPSQPPTTSVEAIIERHTTVASTLIRDQASAGASPPPAAARRQPPNTAQTTSPANTRAMSSAKWETAKWGTAMWETATWETAKWETAKRETAQRTRAGCRVRATHNMQRTRCTQGVACNVHDATLHGACIAGATARNSDPVRPL
jgi:hypothetical protein